MATNQQNINIGTADNANDGDTLRAAFRKVRKMFAEIYGDTDAENLTDTETVPSTSFDTHITEKIEDTVSTMFSDGSHSNITVTYDDSDGTLDLSVAADITDVNAGSGLTGVNEDGGAATLNVGAGDGITVNANDVALSSSVAGSGLTYTSGVLSVNAIDTDGIAADAVDGTKLEQFDDSLTAATSGDILVSNGTDFIHATMSGDATIASGGALTVGNDKITYAKLGAEFTTKATIPSDYDIDFATASVFTDTMDAATIAYDIENPKVGDVKTLVLTGDGTDRTISFEMSGSTGETFNKMKGSDDFVFTSGALNLVQIICVDDTANGEDFWYSNSVIAS